MYVFGGYEIDTDAFELRHGGRVVHIEPQVFDVLRVLVEHRDRVVPKEELLDLVWGDRFVSESALTSRIKAARRAVGDDGKSQRVIRTVHGRGYRFVAPLDPAPRHAEDRPFGSWSPSGGGPGPGRASRSDEDAQPDGAGAAPVVPAAQVASAQPTSRLPAPVGRSEQLSRLHELLAAAVAGAAQVAFVTGEPGIGKSTLVERFAEDVTACGAALVGFGRCVEHRSSGEAYLPVLDALAALGRQRGSEHLRSVLADLAPSWVLQLPGLLDEEARAAAERRMLGASGERMLREMVGALAAAATATPIVVILEDLHWSDPSTLDLLDALAHRPDPARVLVLGTYRPADGRAVHALAEGLRLRGHASAIALGSLTAEDVGELLVARFGGAGAPQGLAEVIERRTGGIPLFVDKLLDGWLAAGAVVATPEGLELDCSLEELSATVPESVRELIEHTFSRLRPLEQEVLEAAAVAGPEFSAAAAAAGCARTEDEVEECCDALARQGVFVARRGEEHWPDLTVASRYGFLHDLHREVVHDRVPAGRRARLHLRIGRRLEEAYGIDPSDVVAALAAHFAGGRDADRAVRYSALAAHRQLERNAHREAMEHLQLARTMLARLPEGRARDERELEILIMAGNALISGRGYAAPETIEVYDRARELCAELGDGPHFLPVLYGLWNNALVAGSCVSAHQLAEAFLRTAVAHDPDVVIVAERAVGWSLMLRGRFADALGHLAAAADSYQIDRHAPLAATYGEDPGVAALATLSWAQWFVGRSDEALDTCRRAEALGRSIHQPLSLAYALTVAANLHRFRGEPEAARRYAEEALEVAVANELSLWEAWASCVRGWACCRLGDVVAGLAVCQQGLEAASLTGARGFQTYFLAVYADALGAAGKPGDGLLVLDDAAAVAEANDERFYDAEIHRLRGELRLAVDPDADVSAAASFIQAADVAAQQGASALRARAEASLAALERT